MTDGPTARTFGYDAGRLVIREDFDAPLAEEVVADFEGHDSG